MILSPGSVIAGKFRLDRPLAQGGMGSVWVAFNTQLEVPVALKFMGVSLLGSAELVARFEREAKAAAQLRNPHVVQIFEHGVDRGTPFIAMELLEGEDLNTRLRMKRRLSLLETSRIVGDVCKALRRAHDQGLIHRDLKPANIFLCKHEEYEVVKVLDFGIAKSMALESQGEATKTGALVGSPHYMSPEQARRTNKQVDHRSDLWSLGVIAFRCVTGHLPFPGEDVIDVLVRVCTEPVPVPSSIAPDLPPEIDRFFARALARDPEARFQSAKDMADALASVAGQPAKERAAGVDSSWSDAPVPPRIADGTLLRAPPPRASQPSAMPAAASDDFDEAKTVPISHPGAQRALEGKPWLSPVAPAPAESPHRPAPSAQFSSALFTAPLPASMSPAASAPQAVDAANPTLFPSPGTLTNAGTEVTPVPVVPRKHERSWIPLAAAVAGVIVVGVVVSAVFLSRGPDDGAAALSGTPPEPALSTASTAVPLTSAPAEPVPTAPSLEPSSATSGNATTSAAVELPPSATPEPKAPATSATTAATSRTPATTPGVKSTPAGGAAAPGALKPKGATTTTSSPGHLGKAKF